MARNFIQSAAAIGMSLLFVHGAAAQFTNVHSIGFSTSLQPAEIYLNGFPVFVTKGTNQATLTLPADPYLVRGTNHFSVLTWQNNTNMAPDESTALRFQLAYGLAASSDETELFTLERLIKVPGTNALLEQITLTNVSGVEIGYFANITARQTFLTLDAQSGEGRYRTNSVAGTNVIDVTLFSTNAPLPSLPWQGASPVLTSQDTTNIQQVVQAVFGAFTNRSIGQITNLFHVKIERLANAHGVSFSDEALIRQQFFSRLFATTPLSIDPFDSGLLTVRVYPTANLVQVTLNGEPPIQATGTGFRYKLPLFLSKIGGAWQIVD